MRHALVTGGAGFIASNLVDALLASGWRVTVVDNFDSFYDPSIKKRNIAVHRQNPAYTLCEVDIRDFPSLMRNLNGDYDVVLHFAAKAGVRPSIEDPIAYQKVNVEGTQNLLELARLREISRFVFASSSSVYGINPNMPWREDDNVLMPISPYAGTKVSGELLGHVYSRLYGMRFIALRLFTVYGPRQRPDLAISKFTHLMLRGEKIPIFGNGDSRRDYTYVDDVVRGILAATDYDATPYEVINLGNNQTISLSELIHSLEEVLHVKAEIDSKPDQPGDVPQTWADIGKAAGLLNYRPAVCLREGLHGYMDWLSAIEKGT